MAENHQTTKTPNHKGLMRPRVAARRVEEIEAAKAVIDDHAAVPKEVMQSWTVRTSAELHKRAKAKAALEGMTLTAVITQALEDYVAE